MDPPQLRTSMKGTMRVRFQNVSTVTTVTSDLVAMFQRFLGTFTSSVSYVSCMQSARLRYFELWSPGSLSGTASVDKIEVDFINTNTSVFTANQSWSDLSLTTTPSHLVCKPAPRSAHAQWLNVSYTGTQLPNFFMRFPPNSILDVVFDYSLFTEDINAQVLPPAITGVSVITGVLGFGKFCANANMVVQGFADWS
jgi:hypothetical protein